MLQKTEIEEQCFYVSLISYGTSGKVVIFRIYSVGPRATTKKWLRKHEELKGLKCNTRKYSLNTKENRKEGTGEQDMRPVENKKQNGSCKSNHINITLNKNGLNKPIKRQFVRLG